MPSNSRHVKVGRLLQSGISIFKVAVPISQVDALAYGALVLVPASDDLTIYGVVADVSYDDDPLTRVMAGAIDIPESTFHSLRDRGATIQLTVFTVGYAQNGQISHGLPPRPPLGLDELCPCTNEQVLTFTSGHGYLRHLLNRLGDPLVADLLGAHLGIVGSIHIASDSPDWLHEVMSALIVDNKRDPGLVRLMLAIQGSLPAEVLR